jgi:AAA domain
MSSDRDPMVRRGKAIVESNKHAPRGEDCAANGCDPDCDPLDILKTAGMLSAAELDRKVFPPMQWHVPGLIPEGFGLLVAPPKAGKSWMVADMGLACAIGGATLGCIQVAGRPVLYLALEDGERRLQDRHRLLLGRDADKPENMKIIVTATPMTAPVFIAAFLDIYGSQAPLIIVDTLVKIRPQRKSGEDPYQFDYMFAARLKAPLDEYPGAGLLAVHHARKATAEDFVAEGSGTYGLAGAADYVIVLRHPRLSVQGSLLVTGRDVPEGEYAVISDQGHGWRLDGKTLTEAAAKAETKAQQGRIGDRSMELLAYVRSRGEKGSSPTDAAKATGIEYAKVKVYLGRLVAAEKLVRSSRGLYIDPVTSVTSVTSNPSAKKKGNTRNRGNNPLLLVVEGQSDRRSDFVPPTGPDRCPECGYHIPTQGHCDDCPANNEEGQ